MSFMHLSSEAQDLYSNVFWGKLQGGTIRIVSDSLCDIGCAFPKSEEKDFSIEWYRMIQSLPSDQCAFLVANFDYISVTDQVQRSKVLFIIWAPNEAPVKQKMLSAFCSKAIIDECGRGGGIGARLQGANMADLDYDVVKEKILRTSTVK